MKINYSGIKVKSSTGVLMLFLFCFALKAQQTSTPLFKSAALTPVNSFTNGVEGPAVDKQGNLYAVNFDHQGSIGRITPAGERSVFVELPAGSIGNGIRFNRKGEMLIADYTMHNVLKLDMSTKQITVFAHEDSMSQPNDIAINNKDCVFASDPDWKNNTGRIWTVDKQGKFVLLEANMGTANGIEVSPDNKRLYVNDRPNGKFGSMIYQKRESP